MLTRISNNLRSPITRLGQRTFSTNAELVAYEQKYICQNYKPYPAVMDRGDRVYMWDVEGNRYLDFMAGYGSVNQGHCHPEIMKAAVDQMKKIPQLSRAYHNTEMAKFGELMCKLTGYDKLMPANGGCEAGESAIKFARRWGYYKKGVEMNKASIVMMKNNFWGRSITASGSSDDPGRYKDFGPFGEGFTLVDYNSIDAIENYLKADKNCVGVFLEPI